MFRRSTVQKLEKKSFSVNHQQIFSKLLINHKENMPTLAENEC